MDRPGGARTRRRRGAGRGRAGRAARVRRLARAPGLRRRAQRRVRRPDGGPAVPGRRHPGHGRGDPRGLRRRAAREPAAADGRDAPPGHDHVRVQVRVRAHRAGRGARAGAGRRGHPRGHLPRCARRAARVRRRPGRLPRPGVRPDAGRLRAVSPLGRRVLRGRGLRRGRSRRGARGGPGRGPRRPGTRQPARTGPRCPGGGRGGRRVGRPLHVPDRRRRGRPDLDAGGRDLAARRGVRLQATVPRRAPAARRGRHRGPGHRLQPGFLVHVQHAVLHRARRPRDADDHRGGGLVRHRGRRAGAAPRPTSAIWASAPGPT